MVRPEDVVSLRVTVRGSDSWQDAQLERSTDGSGATRFSLRTPLPAGTGVIYEAILRVERVGSPVMWVRLPFEGLSSVDNGFGGVNVLFSA
jgi:hypothetical protein